ESSASGAHVQRLGVAWAQGATEAHLLNRNRPRLPRQAAPAAFALIFHHFGMSVLTSCICGTAPRIGFRRIFSLNSLLTRLFCFSGPFWFSHVLECEA